jgi:uncharacterized protein YjhX (UPF0386 family)
MHDAFLLSPGWLVSRMHTDLYQGSRRAGALTSQTQTAYRISSSGAISLDDDDDRSEYMS